jgi:hypothetical protein
MRVGISPDSRWARPSPSPLRGERAAGFSATVCGASTARVERSTLRDRRRKTELFTRCRPPFARRHPKGGGGPLARPTALFPAHVLPAHASQPIAWGVAAGHFIPAKRSERRPSSPRRAGKSCRVRPPPASIRTSGKTSTARHEPKLCIPPRGQRRSRADIRDQALTSSAPAGIRRSPRA